MKNFITMIEKDSIEILKAESNHSFPLHSHECFCFGIVHQGRVIFEIGNDKKELSKGMCYIIPSNVGVIITPPWSDMPILLSVLKMIKKTLL